MAKTQPYSQRAEVVKRAVTKRRKRIRAQAVEHLGGRCYICGYNRCAEALDIHHRDPSKKSFGISEKGNTRSWSRVLKEIQTCILICANCHREIHAGITQLPSVTTE